MISVLQIGIFSNRRTWTCDNAQNMTCRNYMLVQVIYVNDMNKVYASIVHFRSTAHICFIVMTLCAFSAGMLRVQIAWAVLEYLTNEIFV